MGNREVTASENSSSVPFTALPGGVAHGQGPRPSVHSCGCLHTLTEDRPDPQAHGAG